MKVLHVINSLVLAGAEVLVANLVPRLRKRGIECDVAVLTEVPSPLPQKIEESGARLYRIGARGRYSLGNLFALRRLIRGYDILHAHLFPEQFWVGLAARSDRPGLFVTQHAVIDPAAGFLTRRTLRRFEVVVCVSEAVAESLRRWPEIATKTVIVPNGCDVASFDAARAAPRESVGNGRLLGVFVARMDKEKDHETLLRALSLLPELHLAFVGEGPARIRLERLAATLGVDGRAHFLGYRRDVPSLLKAADIYLHCSPRESFGISVLEAMAAGLPVVANDLPAFRSWTDEAALLVERRPEAFAEAVRRLAGDDAFRRRLAEQGREVARRFDIEHTADAYAALYSKARGQSRAAEGHHTWL